MEHMGKDNPNTYESIELFQSETYEGISIKFYSSGSFYLTGKLGYGSEKMRQGQKIFQIL